MSINVSGEMSFKLIGPDGVVKSEDVVKNLVVNGGRDFLFSQTSGTGTVTNMKYMGVGTDNTAAGATQTALETEIGTRQSISYAHSAGATTMTATATFGAGNATGTIQEAGLFTASSGGTMFNRVNGINKVKGADDSLEITYTLTITAS